MKRIILLLAIMLTVSANTSLNAQKVPDLAVNPSFQYNIPFGTFGDIWGSGLGLNVALETNIISNVNIGAQVGYIFWTPVAENNQYDIVFYNIPIEVYLLYYFDEAGGFRPYAGLELGYHMTTHSQELIATKYVERFSDENIGFSPVFGIITGFSDGLLLDANIKYTTILSGDGDDNTGKENMSIFSFNIGIMIEV